MPSAAVGIWLQADDGSDKEGSNGLDGEEDPDLGAELELPSQCSIQDSNNGKTDAPGIAYSKIKVLSGNQNSTISLESFVFCKCCFLHSGIRCHAKYAGRHSGGDCKSKYRYGY